MTSGRKIRFLYRFADKKQTKQNKTKTKTKTKTNKKAFP